MLNQNNFISLSNYYAFCSCYMVFKFLISISTGLLDMCILLSEASNLFRRLVVNEL